MNKSIKVIVLDLDRTILGESGKITPKVKQAIQTAQDRGVKVAIATGRPVASALPYYNEISSQLPLIAHNGAIITNPNRGEIYQHLTIDIEIAVQVLNLYQQIDLQSELSLFCYIQERVYLQELTPQSQLYSTRNKINPLPVGDLRQVLTTSPTCILAIIKNSSMMKQLWVLLQKNYDRQKLYITKSSATMLETLNPGANKGAAVRYLVEEHLGLSAENVMTIGDNFNDLEMIEYSSIGVAMGNAPQEVQDRADWVAPSVQADGVAAAIAKFL
ncbi:MAG: Cof-type HAD-IIB family hydrolase [Hormoscilla sp.]